MNPLSVAPRSDQPGAPQVSQMARHFGLVCLQRLDEGANANLLVAQELNQTQPRGIGEGLEEQLDVEILIAHLLRKR